MEDAPGRDHQTRLAGPADELDGADAVAAEVEEAVVDADRREPEDLANGREQEVYRRNLRRVVDGLEARFADCPGVSWNTPADRFFVSVTVPFTVDDDLLEVSARRFGVLWTPMCHFYSGPGGSNELRLSVSSLSGAEIEEGLDRLAALFVERSRGSVNMRLVQSGDRAP
ncbi:hypothetical protein RB201_04915 [Streptomyces sp. S1A(2023)]